MTKTSTAASTSEPKSSRWNPVVVRSLRSSYVRAQLEHRKLQAFITDRDVKSRARDDGEAGVEVESEAAGHGEAGVEVESEAGLEPDVEAHDDGEAGAQVESEAGVGVETKVKVEARGYGEAGVSLLGRDVEADLQALMADLDLREALARDPYKTSCNGVKLTGTQRLKLDKNRDRVLSQVTLCRAALNLGDLTTSRKLHGCSTRFLLLDQIEAKASYFDDDKKDPAYTNFNCEVGPCHFCGGARDRVDNHLRRILNARSTPDAPRNFERPKSDFHYLRFSSFRLGGPLVDGVYKILNEAIKAITDTDVFKLFFEGASLDIELFNKRCQVCGHFTVVGLKRPLARARRRELLNRMRDTWAEIVEGGEFFEEPLRETLFRAADYNAKGFKPDVKPNPHLGQPIEQMEALLKLALGFKGGVLGSGVRDVAPAPNAAAAGDVSRARYHWPIGSWRKGKLTRASDTDDAKEAEPAQEAPAKPKRRKRPRREIRTEAQMQEFMRSRVRIPGRVVFNEAGKPIPRAHLVAVSESLAEHIVKRAPAPGPVFANRSPDDEHEAIADRVRSGAHTVVQSVAGGGKSSEIARQVKAQLGRRILAVVFGVGAMEVLKRKVSSAEHITVSTLHGVGHRGLTAHFGREPRVNDGKVAEIAAEILAPGDVAEVVRLVSMAKANVLLPDGDLTTLGSLPSGVESQVREVLRRSNAIEDVVDYDDQIYLPLIAGITLPEFNFVAVDEVQDLTRSEVDLALALGRNAQMVVVGDRYQAISDHRNAMADAIREMSQRLGVDELTMSYTHRCPVRVVEKAQQYVPLITAMPGAPDGWVRDTGDELHNPRLFRPGDLVLCRYQDVLMKLAERMHALDLRPNLMFNPDRERSPSSSSSSSRGYKRHQINLSTIHSAKGETAPRVFYLQVPPRHAMNLPVHLQEHRNLAYVAITRAAEGVAFLTPATIVGTQVASPPAARDWRSR